MLYVNKDDNNRRVISMNLLTLQTTNNALSMSIMALVYEN